jgi:hypothetical protein
MNKQEIKKNRVILENDQEHVVLGQDGDVSGLYNLNPLAITGGSLWDKVKVLVEEYTRLHPQEMQLHIMETKAISESRRNATASSKDKSIRWGCSIPVGLMFKLEVLAPDLFSDKKNYYGFLKRYPGFRICKSV